MNWFKHIFSGDHSPPESPAPVTKVENREPRRQPTIAADNPIASESDDALNRTTMAHSFADQIQAIDARNGLVVGVLGPWGSGKTSFVNLARRNLEDAGIAVLDFNPWMFSGADQLVQAFFVELTAQLKLRPDFAEIGGLIEDYGEAFSGLGWLPFVGPWIERGHKATGILAKLLQSKKEGAGQRRAKVTRALTDIPAPIVVVLDDIDRLTTPEIRDVFKLVRLTANFPNIVYLLAFDRVRVEQALGEQGIPGRDYLEKILQIGVDLPAVPFDVLNSQIFTGIDGALVGIEKPGDFDSNVWPDVFIPPYS
ncbi:KAP family P-loop NTPase fold protein [Halomonas mongoliensis]|uniref:KAP family P-loop NTPase fold protein n=1 Tax=Halomonas mongoliensis TaxID=321265 RepID=UPI00403B2669